MMMAWLSVHQQGKFSLTGLLDPSDDTVVTPQATVDYGYNWFSISEAPVVVVTPESDKSFPCRLLTET